MDELRASGAGTATSGEKTVTNELEDIVMAESGAGAAQSGAELQMQADALKEDGNRLFQEGKHALAVATYAEAIKLAPSAVLYCNRAFAQLKLENYGNAIEDADQAIRLDPSFPKSYYRKGSAYIAIGKYKEARAAFDCVLKFKPGDKDAKAKRDEADKQVKRAAFEAAIDSGPQHGSSAKNVDPSTITIDASYRGPHLPAFPGSSDGFSVRSSACGPSGVLASTVDLDNATEESVNEQGMSLAFVKALMADFKSQRLVHKKYAVELLLRAKRHFEHQAPIVNVSWPPTTRHFNVCGDTHGQYYDTCNIFESQSGLPGPENPYVFNGDFVDRGSWSVENVLLLFSWMLLYPRYVFLTRGNHETRNMNRMYGFDGEVKHKYDSAVLDLFTDVFCSIPVGLVIDRRVLVVHGGLPTTDGATLADMAKIDRFREPPEGGLMSDLLWSDPQPFPGRGPSKRGVGKSFGPDVTANFLSANGLELLVRSHEVRDEGYLVEHAGKCITVFSAPNYCDQMGNKGGVVRLVRRSSEGPRPASVSSRVLAPGEEGEYTLAFPEFISFSAVSHPPVKPMAYAGGGLAGMFGL